MGRNRTGAPRRPLGKMGEKQARAYRTPALGDRVRSALGGVRRQGSASLREVRRTVVEATDRLKGTEVAERLGAAVEVRRRIWKAADAQRRGNPALAFRLLEPAVRDGPDDARLVAAFWRAARACERTEEAVPALVHVIRRLAGTGKPEQAMELWLELREAAPTALVDPGALVRIATVLQAQGRPDRTVHALREAVDPANSGLTPGLAARLAEMAAPLDPPTALSAARRALACPDLHAARRGRLEDLVAELRRADRAAADTAAPNRAPDPPEPPAARVGTGGAVGEVSEAPVPAARFADLRVTEAMPIALGARAIGVQLRGGRRARIEYSRIEAVAVAELTGLAPHPVLVIDLALNWSAEGDRALRLVRLRGDGFDPRMLMDAPEDPGQARRAFLAGLLERCDAIPLPDLDGALGASPHRFADLEAYQRAVLRVAG